LIPIALFTSVSSLNAFILRFNDKNASALAYSFLIPVVGYSSLFITLYLTHSTTYAFAAWLVSLFIAFILIFIRDPIYPNTSIYDIFRLSLDVKVAFPYYILNILGWFSGYGMNFIVDLRFTLDEVSQYTFLSSIAALSQLILASVQMLWSPSFLRMISSSPYEAAQKSHKIYSIVTLIIPLLASIAYLLAMHFSSISGFSILEKSYSTVYLLILFIAYLLCIPYWQAQDYLVANNASFMLLNITLISAAISFPLWIYLQSLIGIPGIFVGFAIQMFVKSFVAVIMTPKTWKVRPPYLPISLSVACLSIIVVFTALHNS
jgi:O-antigen/teichoic acid export membrane protein